MSIVTFQPTVLTLTYLTRVAVDFKAGLPILAINMVKLDKAWDFLRWIGQSIKWFKYSDQQWLMTCVDKQLDTTHTRTLLASQFDGRFSPELGHSRTKSDF